MTENIKLQESDNSLKKEDKPTDKKSFVSFLNIKLDTEENIQKSLTSIRKELYIFALLVLVFHAFLYFINQGDLFFLVDVCILSTIGYFLPITKSRSLAVFLSFYALTTVLVTAQNMVGASHGGKNILLAIVLIMMSINTIKSTFAFHKLNKTKIRKRNVFIYWTAVLTLILGCFIAVTITYGVLLGVFQIPEVKEEILGAFIIGPLIILIPLISLFLRKKFPMAYVPEITE